jgi:peptidoglycan/LPS O-acetylase OafA/YrhL
VNARLHEIDLLRIGAALAVVLYHYLFSGPAGGLTEVAYPVAGQVARYGYLGVDLFFMISGFVVLMTAWNRSPSGFVLSRAVRLYPAYWVALTLTATVSALAGSFPVTVPQYLANLTMLNSLVDVPNVDVVYWTLWAELRFYAVVGLLVVIGPTRRRVLVVLWSWLAATAVLESGQLPPGISATADLVVQSQFSHYFVAGMALFLVHRSGLSGELVAILGLCLANAVFRGTGFAEAVSQRYHITVHPGVVIVVIVAIFALMTSAATGVTRRLARPWFAVAGSLTYPLYLIHAHIGFTLFDALDEHVPRWPLALGLVVAMCGTAYAIHAGVERPLTALIRARTSRRPIRS